MTLDAALERMPHEGSMLLIEQVLEADPNHILCRAKDHRGPDYPLRINGRLLTVSLVELGAQAAAAHASLYGLGGAHAGLLLALHAVEFGSDEVAVETPLIAEAIQIAFLDGGARYRFRVADGGSDLIAGEAMLTMRLLEA